MSETGAGDDRLREIVQVFDLPQGAVAEGMGGSPALR